MPSEYHGSYTPHPCLIQDQSASRNSHYCKLCDARKSSNLLPKEAIEPCSPRQVARIFIFRAVWVTLSSCNGGSGGSSERATGSNAPTIDGSATGGQRNPVCVAGTSRGGVTRPEIIVSLNDGFMNAFSADARELGRFNFTHGKAVMYDSEATLSDLNQDGSPEILFTDES